MMYKVGKYLSNDEAEVVGWIRKRDLLTSDSALKEQGVYVKAFPVTRFDDKEDKVEEPNASPNRLAKARPLVRNLRNSVFTMFLMNSRKSQPERPII